MAEVTLTIGDRRHAVACRDGEEAQLKHLGSLLAERWPSAQSASGGISHERTMLFIALLLADALEEANNRPPDLTGNPFVERIAARLEALAEALEQPVPGA